MESNMDIVTSYQGTDHITADQMADLQRGIFGGDCILPVGNKMKVNIQTSNQITISDGVSVYDGREIYIAHGKSENVAITSGTQGMMRNDIVCIQYNRDEQTGIESVAPVVVAGTPVASDPQDPAYSNLDIRTGVFMSQKPFCRVRLNGTAIEAIDMLVEVYDKGIYQLNKDLNDNFVLSVIKRRTSSFSVNAESYLWLDIPHDEIEGYTFLGIASFEAGSPSLAVNAVSNGMRVVNPRDYKIDVNANAAFIEYVYVKAGKASN